MSDKYDFNNVIDDTDDNGFTVRQLSVWDREVPIARLKAILPWGYTALLQEEVLQDAEAIDPRFYDGLSALKAAYRQSEIRTKDPHFLAVTDVFVREDYRHKGVFRNALSTIAESRHESSFVALRYISPANMDLDPITEISSEEEIRFKDQAIRNKKNLEKAGWRPILGIKPKYHNNCFYYTTGMSIISGRCH